MSPPVEYRAWRHALVSLGAASVIGCGQKVAGPPEVPLVIGAWCTDAQLKPVVAHTVNGVEVTLHISTTTSQVIIRPSDGALIKQAVHGCEEHVCVFANPGSLKDGDLVAACQDLFG